MNKILMVDDQESNLAYFTLILQELGLNFECFNNAQAALDKVKTEPISAVFLDLEMPGMNGVEAALYMRTWQIQSKSKFFVYAISSHDKSWLGDKNFAQYFDDFIPRHEFKNWIKKHKSRF